MRRAGTGVVGALAVAGAIALTGGAAAGGAPSGSAAKRPVKKVKVGDNFFFPARVTVRKGTRVSWRWSRGNGETHDVLLLRRPKGVKRFQSAPAATGYSYTRRLKKPGRYFLICTFHEEMTMRIKVKARG